MLKTRARTLRRSGAGSLLSVAERLVTVALVTLMGKSALTNTKLSTRHCEQRELGGRVRACRESREE